MPGMSQSRYHLQSSPIPDDLEIYVDRVEVAGVAHHKNEARAFAASAGGWVEMERDVDNKYDPNAIRLIGCSKGFFGIKHRLIGYVPKEIAARIVQGGFVDSVRPRLLKTYVSDGGFVEILFQLLGPKGRRYDFDPPVPPDGSHYTAFVDRVKELKARSKLDEAIDLLLRLIDDIEKEAKREGGPLPPWYYEQLAIIYRKQKRYSDEVQILQRHEAWPETTRKLSARLIKAIQLRDRHA